MVARLLVLPVAQKLCASVQDVFMSKTRVLSWILLGIEIIFWCSWSHAYSDNIVLNKTRVYWLVTKIQDIGSVYDRKHERTWVIPQLRKRLVRSLRRYFRRLLQMSPSSWFKVSKVGWLWTSRQQYCSHLHGTKIERLYQHLKNKEKCITITSKVKLKKHILFYSEVQLNSTHRLLLLASCLSFTLNLKMEAIFSYETSGCFLFTHNYNSKNYICFSQGT